MVHLSLVPDVRLHEVTKFSQSAGKERVNFVIADSRSGPKCLFGCSKLPSYGGDPLAQLAGVDQADVRDPLRIAAVD